MKNYKFFGDFNLDDKKGREGTKMIEYDYSSDNFYILYEDEFSIKAYKGKDSDNF